MTTPPAAFAAAVAACALLAVSACSSQPDATEGSAPAGNPQGSAPAAEPTPPPLPSWKAADGPVTFECNDPRSGAVYEFSLPTDDTNETIKKVEALRKEAKLTGKVSYLMVKIDATRGVAQNSGALYQVVWATADQASRQTKGIDDALSDWRREAIPDINKPGTTELYNKFVALENQLMKTQPNQGAKGYELHVLDQLDTPIDSMVAPYANASAFDSAPCVTKK